MPNKQSPSYKFCFTLYHWTPTDWEFLQRFAEENENVKYLKVAQEHGTREHKPHLQGVVIFKRQAFGNKRPSAVSKLLMGPNKNIALEDPENPGKFLKHHYYVETMMGTQEEALSYCGDPLKEADCVTYTYGEPPKTRPGTRTDHIEVMRIIKEACETGKKWAEIEQIPELQLFMDKSPKWVRRKYMQYRKSIPNFFETYPMFKWQQDLVEYLRRPPDPRKILFVVDLIGNIGKSEFARNAHYLIPEKTVFMNKPKDTKSLSSLIPEDGAEVILIDAPRHIQYSLPYDWLEEAKDGDITNTKYEVTQKRFLTPHLVVFMNRHPKTGHTVMSHDRYLIIEPKLTEEEKENMTSKAEATIDPYVALHAERTEEILKECEEERCKKAAEAAEAKERWY